MKEWVKPELKMLDVEITFNSTGPAVDGSGFPNTAS